MRRKTVNLVVQLRDPQLFNAQKLTFMGIFTFVVSCMQSMDLPQDKFFKLFTVQTSKQDSSADVVKGREFSTRNV